MRHLILILAWLCLLPAVAHAGSNHHNVNVNGGAGGAGGAGGNATAHGGSASSSASASASSNSGSSSGASANDGDVDSSFVALAISGCQQGAAGEGFGFAGESRFCECTKLYAVAPDPATKDGAMACMKEETGIVRSPLGQVTHWVQWHVVQPLVEPLPFLGQHAY